MRKLAAALVLAASCSAAGARKGQVREAFEAWSAAAAAGDAVKTVRWMTAGFRSDWAFKLLNSGDSAATDWRARLEGPARTDLDLWLVHQKKNYQGRAETVPATVLAHPSFDRMLVECIARERESLRLLLSDVAVSEVYIDDTGATVAVRNSRGKIEMYSMAPGPEGWMVDGYSAGPRTLPR